MKYQKIHNRLRRIEGQIRGIEEMIASDKKEVDILIQLEAAKSSLASTLSSFIEGMVEMGDENKVILDETEIRAILRIVKKN